MSSLIHKHGILKIVLLFVVINLVASGMPASLEASESGTFRGKWWNYYDRGLESGAKGDWGNALKDFTKAIDMRNKDQRMARTYGIHFIDYFPHRELGITLFHLGELTKALKELEESVQSTESSKAIHYLNQVRKALLSGTASRQILPPQIFLNEPADGRLIKDRSVRLSGKAQGEGFISAIRINGKPYPVEKSEKEVPFIQSIELEDGANSILVFVEDLLGNRSEMKVTVNAKRDGPGIALSKVVPEERNGMRFVRVTGEITDSAGIRRITVGNKDVTSNDDKLYRLDIAVERTADSSTFFVRAFDVLGNETVAPIDLSQLIRDERIAEDASVRQQKELERLAEEEAARELAAQQLALQRLTMLQQEALQRAQKKAEADKVAAEKLELERVMRAEAEKVRIARELAEQQALAAERAKAERLAREKAEQQRMAIELAERERLAVEKASAEKAAQEIIQQQLLAQQKIEQDRADRQKAEAKRLELEQIAREQRARDSAEQERREREQAAAILVERQKLKAILDEQKLSKALGAASDKQLDLGKIASGEGTKPFQPTERPPAAAPVPAVSSGTACKSIRADREKPIITLKGLDAIPQVFVDSFPLDGEISDNCRVERLLVNGRNVSISKGRKIYFSKVVRIENGKNTIKLEAFDGAGNKAVGTIVVTRKLPSVLQSGSRMSLVVLPFDFASSTSSITPLASQYLTGAMTDQKRFLIAERLKLKNILDEQKFSQAMLEDAERTAELGRLMAAEAIVATSVRETDHSLEVTSRIINTETSEIMNVLDAYSEDKSHAAVKELMTGLAAKIARVFPIVEGVVISHDGDQVTTNLGAGSHVKHRHGAIIYRKGIEIIHPSSGKSLGWDSIKLGEGYIEEVQKGFSKVRIADRFRDNKINPSDLVMTK